MVARELVVTAVRVVLVERATETLDERATAERATELPEETESRSAFFRFLELIVNALLLENAFQSLQIIFHPLFA